MRILVLGGTAWLGFAVAKVAVAMGHEVTCVARGDKVPAGVRLVRADREDDHALQELAKTRWHAVVDVARQPVFVRRSVRDLEKATDRYIFVSTGNVYASQKEVGADEDSLLLSPLQSDRIATPDDYGPAKVACENEVLAAFGPDRSVIARVGLIGGPGDPTGRTTYWVRRFASPSNDDGAVVVPDTPELPTAMIDVRDLATWLVRMAVNGAGGIFNAVGNPLPFHEHTKIARSVAGHLGPVVAAPEQWLLQQGVNEWSGEGSLPFWLVDPEWHGMNARSNKRAIDAGLELRPLQETLSDILVEEPALSADETPRSGLANTEETQLLNALTKAGLVR